MTSKECRMNYRSPHFFFVRYTRGKMKETTSYAKVDLFVLYEPGKLTRRREFFFLIQAG